MKVILNARVDAVEVKKKEADEEKDPHHQNERTLEKHKEESVSTKEPIFNYFQDNVNGPAMKFLNASSGRAGDDPFRFGPALEFAAPATAQHQGAHAAGCRQLQRKDEVGGIAAGGEEDQHVAGSAQRLDLPTEDAFKAEVIGDAGQRGAICDQGDGRKSPAVLLVAPDQFLGKMESVGRAATIAGGQNFVAGEEGVRNDLGATVQRFEARLGCRDGADQFGILLLDDGVHVEKIGLLAGRATFKL
jgi:hypothetical protein